MTANVKQRILEKTIAALDPRKDGEAIARLQSELRTMASPVPALEPSETPVGASEGGQASQLTEKDIDDYRANGPREVSLRTRWGMVYLVKEKTGADRFELLPEDIVKIQTARRLFGADVVDLAFKGKALQNNNPKIG